ncbi:MAG: hypothetical protein ACKPKO_00655, partial [Candidatus Fonsibacter sp.]
MQVEEEHEAAQPAKKPCDPYTDPEIQARIAEINNHQCESIAQLVRGAYGTAWAESEAAQNAEADEAWAEKKAEEAQLEAEKKAEEARAAEQLEAEK